MFRYPRSRTGHGFAQQYSIETQLGKGHFATVYLCIERNSGMKFAVKKFEKRPGPGDKSKIEGLQQEVAVLMGISHPNLLCLKDVFDEDDGTYLVLELAVEGELFNWIVMKSKLSEVESRKIFIQLFQGLKYLVCTVSFPLLSFCTDSSSTSAILCTETSSPRISFSLTGRAGSSLLISAWPRSLARSPLRLPCTSLAAVASCSFPLRLVIIF